jgi:hypothetical protein
MLLDPLWTLRAGTVPYWTTFPVQPSVEALNRYLDGAEPYEHLHLGLFCHGVESVGMATVEQWRDVLRRATVSGAFAGVSPRRYPTDPRTFFEFQAALRSIRPRLPIPDEPLSLSQAEDSLREAPGVHLDIS